MSDTWSQFAEQLFRTEDADPMYYALARASLDTGTKMRFFVGWCTYYHPGVAAMAAQYEGAQFWDALRNVYDTAPRASERRHFRGKAGLKALDAWEQMYPAPERMIDTNLGNTYFQIRDNLKKVPQFGDYFFWKFADVQDRVFRVPCDFSGAEEHAPKVPKEGAKLIAEAQRMPDATTKDVFDLIIRVVRPRLAPPAYDRPLNMQEAETICCVYHQYIGGGYEYYGHRTDKAFRRLSAYPNRITEALLDALTLSLPHTPREEQP